jgi:hypothetical protein
MPFIFSNYFKVLTVLKEINSPQIFDYISQIMILTPNILYQISHTQGK